MEAKLSTEMTDEERAQLLDEINTAANELCLMVQEMMEGGLSAPQTFSALTILFANFLVNEADPRDIAKWVAGLPENVNAAIIALLMDEAHGPEVDLDDVVGVGGKPN